MSGYNFLLFLLPSLFVFFENKNVLATEMTHVLDSIKIDGNYFANGNIKPIRGKWEFYEGVHIYGKIENTNSLYRIVDVPRCTDCLPPLSNTDTAKATYRTVILKSKDVPELSLVMYGLYKKYKLIVNGKEVYTSSQFTHDEKGKMRGRTRDVIRLPNVELIELRILIYDEANLSLSIPYPPLIGQSHNISKNENLRMNIEMIEIGCLLIMSIFNLFLFFQLRQKAYLLMSLICLAVLIRASLIFDGSLLLYRMIPYMTIMVGRKLEFFVTYSTLFLPAIFIRELFKERLFVNITNFLVVVGSCMMFLTAFFSASVFAKVLNVYHALMAVTFFVVFATLFIAIKKRKVGAKTVTVGVIICFVFVAKEIIQNSGLINSENFGPNPVGTGLVIYLFAQTMAISAIFSKAHKENIVLNAELERKVQARTEQLSKSNMIKEQLIGIISHDIKNPLNSLKSLFIMLDSNKLSEDKRQNLTSKIKKSLNMTLGLLEELISWSTNQLKYSDEFEITQKKINIYQLIETNFELFKESTSKKSVTLINQSGRKLEAYSDEDVAKMILRNLVNNAIKFTEKGGRVGVTSTIEDDKVVISVTDTGLGIPQDIKNSLFTPGKATRIGTNNEKGSGLGLVLCKDLAIKNNGDLWLERTEIGYGSTFKFSLPYIE